MSKVYYFSAPASHQPQTSVFEASQHQAATPGDFSLYPGLSGSYMSSPAPILVNPPPMPTYSYGIPPYPVPMMHPPPPGHAPFIQSHASLPLMGPKQSPGLRRAGSINAKIFNAEARCAKYISKSDGLCFVSMKTTLRQQSL